MSRAGSRQPEALTIFAGTPATVTLRGTSCSTPAATREQRPCDPLRFRGFEPHHIGFAARCKNRGAICVRFYDRKSIPLTYGLHGYR